MGKSGFSRLLWEQDGAGSNPAFAIVAVRRGENTLGMWVTGGLLPRFCDLRGSV